MPRAVTGSPACTPTTRSLWSLGGNTDLKDGVSLCHWHHNRAHDPNYHTTYHPNGDVTFHRRT